MATQPATASAQSDGPFAPITKLFGDFGALIGSIAGFATAVGVAWQGESERLGWAMIGVASLILLYAFVAQVIHPWLSSRRQRKIIALVETESSKPTIFRLRPYEEVDHDAFSRPDNAHEKALLWLDAARAPCLYLTGFSGTGKSSLLQAWLIPELGKAKPPVTTVVVRSFADPIRQLVEAVKREGAVPVDLPEDETDPRALLERAAGALTLEPRRLLIAIDQFEECLILQDDETKARLAALLTDLRNNPIKGLQLLFVLRTDYLKFDELAALGLPDPIPRENWFNLEALSHPTREKSCAVRCRISARGWRIRWSSRRATSTICPA